MNFFLFALLLCASVCSSTSQAFVIPSPAGSLSATRTAAAAGRRWSRRTTPRSQGVDTDTDTREVLRLGMVFGRDRSSPSPPQLSEEELAAMAKSREEANVKVEEFLERRRAEKEARRNAALEEQRQKVSSRIKAEKADAEHKKEYIPRRLEEIEEEEANLQDRVSAFNSKIKDKEIKEL